MIVIVFTPSTPSARSRNLEIKVLCPALDEVRQRLVPLDATISERLRQIDTYFQVPHGRLKLRTIAAMTGDAIGPVIRAELIGYQRANVDGSRWSSYQVTPIAPEAAGHLHASLADALGIVVTVAKRREIAIAGATRIHLDTVDDLGSFVELETMIGDQSDEAASTEHAQILAALGLDRWRVIAGSYSDLLRSAHTA